MAFGQTAWFDPYKGYGFITGEDGIDYFAHWKNIDMNGYKKLAKHKSVSFVPMRERNSYIATNIKIVA